MMIGRRAYLHQFSIISTRCANTRTRMSLTEDCRKAYNTYQIIFVNGKILDMKVKLVVNDYTNFEKRVNEAILKIESESTKNIMNYIIDIKFNCDNEGCTALIIWDSDVMNNGEI